jgi:diacylglycerol kinase family enzyme
VRALVVVNPAATATTPKVREVLVRALASELTLVVAETEYRGHARELGRRAVADGVDVVVSVGGDGTANEVVNGVLADGPAPGGPALAVVPGGSTNVFARALGRSRNPVEATAEILESLRAGRVRSVSLGRAFAATGAAGSPDEPDEPDGAAWRWFLFAAGLGFDADVIARVEGRRATGRRSTPALYVREATGAFLAGGERRRPGIALHVPGEPPRDGLFACLISNVSPWTYLGTRPLDPNPQASFETGLDACAFGRTGPVGMLSTVGQALRRDPDPRGRHLYRWHDLPELRLVARRPQRWQLDGDALGTTAELRLRSVPHALRVVV